MKTVLSVAILALTAGAAAAHHEEAAYQVTASGADSPLMLAAGLGIALVAAAGLVARRQWQRS